jgi:hypothetical protein
MTQDEFRTAVQDFFISAERELVRKNADYAPGSNPFEAFDEAARMLGLSREQVWAVFYMKHVQALVRWIAEGRLTTESIESRLTDLSTYPAILAAMIQDSGGTDETRPTGDPGHPNEDRLWTPI